MKNANTWIAALFLLILSLMAGLILLGAPVIGSTLLNDWHQRENPAPASLMEKAEFVTDHSEAALNKGLDRSHVFIELYGAVQRLTGQRLVEDTTPDTSVTRLDNGTLTFSGLGNVYIDPTENAEHTAALFEALEAEHIPFLAAVAPGKIPPDTLPMPEPVREYSNPIADRYLAVLAEQDVPSLDLRPAFAAREDYADLFFRTDHHWRPEGALFAARLLMQDFSTRYGFSVDEDALREDRFEKTVYENWFLGSQGKRVGSLYAGTDDFTVYTPKFDTDFTYLIEDSGAVREGRFEEALCFPERIAEKDWFSGNPYTYYSGGDYGVARMINHKNPTGPKIVMLRDSYSCALAPFLALQCSELVTVDLRYFEGELSTFLVEEAPELALLLYTASTTRLPHMFDFDTP